MDNLETIQHLAASQRLAVIEYQKPNDPQLTRRCVEPYRLQYTDSAVMALCWQVEPDTMSRTCWRNFRVDRMRSVQDGGRTFVPRVPITIHTGEAQAFSFGDRVQGSLSSVNVYFQFLEQAMLDSKIKSDELARAKELGRVLSVDQVRAVHGQIFANILREVLIDGEIDDSETVYLVSVRKMLKKLGYAPGEKDSLE